MTETYLFIDTEGTGFKKGGSLIQKDQARVCQIAMILTDNVGGIIAEATHLLKPDNWEISQGAQDCHGISIEECELYGLPQSVMLTSYFYMAHKAQKIVAHNILYDKSLMEIEVAYAKESPVTRPWYCTMEASRDICRLPPTDKMKNAGRYNYKSPTLAEAYKHFTGKDLEGAHDAMIDARACKDIFFAMKGIK